MANLYVLVQNAVLDAVNDFAAGTGFKEITYGTDGKASLGASVSPSNVRANEVSGSFRASNNKRSWFRERDEWTWELMLEFPRKVELEGFKDEVITNGLKVDRTADNPPVFLNFENFIARHAVEEQGSATGTTITWTINAQVERFR